MLRWALATASMIAVWAIPTLARAQPDQLLRIEIHSFAELEQLHELGLDVLTERPGPGWVDVRVPGERRSIVAASAMNTEVIVDDLSLPQRSPSAAQTDAFFDDFREYPDIEAHLQTLATDLPDRVETFEIGRSIEDRPLWAVRITHAPDDAPTLLVTAGLHAREWIAVSSGVCIADSLATRAAEPEFAALLDEVAFVVVPVVNPDGYVYTWQGQEERFWRKNRRDGIGVDLNRNFSTGFGGPGSTGNPARQNYRGEAAFSEPEAAAIRDLAQDIGDVRAHLDVHSFGQLVLRPWGHVTEDPPAIDVLLPLSETLATAMTNFDGVQYIPESGTDLYPAAGNSQDWAYGELGAMSFTLELRPSEVEQFNLGFVLPPEQIEDICLESMQAVLELATWTAASEPGVPGDTGDLPEPMGTSTGEASTGPTGPPDPETTSTTTGTVPPMGTTGVATTTDEPDEADDGDGTDDGCGCTAAPSRVGQAVPWLLVLLGARRRRR
jgi:carboxypeptidase T